MRTNIDTRRQRAQKVCSSIARVLFCIREGRLVLLHAFIKKTQKTPDADRSLALKRMKEIA